MTRKMTCNTTHAPGDIHPGLSIMNNTIHTATIHPAAGIIVDAGVDCRSAAENISPVSPVYLGSMYRHKRIHCSAVSPLFHAMLPLVVCTVIAAHNKRQSKHGIAAITGPGTGTCEEEGHSYDDPAAAAADALSAARAWESWRSPRDDATVPALAMPCIAAQRDILRPAVVSSSMTTMFSVTGDRSGVAARLTSTSLQLPLALLLPSDTRSAR